MSARVHARARVRVCCGGMHYELRSNSTGDGSE